MLKSNMARIILKDKVTFNMELQNVSQLKQAYSDALVIHGLKWNFKIEKIVANQEKNRRKDTIGVSLHCNIPSEYEDFMCGARAKIKLLSVKDRIKPYHRCLCSIYDANTTSWKCSSFIEWKKLFSNGYVQDGNGA